MRGILFQKIPDFYFVITLKLHDVWGGTKGLCEAKTAALNVPE
jgi:hypothetical protein